MRKVYHDNLLFLLVFSSQKLTEKEFKEEQKFKVVIKTEQNAQICWMAVLEPRTRSNNLLVLFF